MLKSNLKMILKTTCKLEAARNLARLIQYIQAMIYSQWFPGRNNVVSDCLSRDLHESPAHLKKLLTSIIPHQLPHNLRIAPLPPMVISRLSSLLARMPIRTEHQVRHKTSRLEAGTDGSPSSPTLVSTTTTNYPNSPSHGSKPFSSVHL